MTSRETRNAYTIGVREGIRASAAMLRELARGIEVAAEKKGADDVAKLALIAGATTLIEGAKTLEKAYEAM